MDRPDVIWIGRVSGGDHFHLAGDNRIETITTGGINITYGLDALGRTLTRSDGTTTSTYRYAGDGDTADWVVDGTSTTRYVAAGGGLSAVQQMGGATTWLLTAPHGDVWAHTDNTGTITATFAYDEYGVPTGGTSTGTLAVDRYAWLGHQQRETDPTTGLIAMGVRMYAPTLGRFLSVDPVHGGSANNYDYVAGDPINQYDLDGKWSWRGVLKAAVIVAGVAGAIACGASVVCGVAVGVAAGAASYSASNAGTRRFSWGGLAKGAAIGGVLGRLSAAGYLGRGREVTLLNKSRFGLGKWIGGSGRPWFARIPHYHRGATHKLRGLHRPWQGGW